MKAWTGHEKRVTTRWRAPRRVSRQFVHLFFNQQLARLIRRQLDNPETFPTHATGLCKTTAAQGLPRRECDPVNAAPACLQDTIYTRAMRANPNLPMIDLADLRLTSEELNRWKAIPEVAAEIRRQEAIDIVVGTTEALAEERGGDKVYGSMVKQALKRVRPGFAESYYGCRAVNAMVEAARDAGALALERDDKSGGYVVRLAAGDD